MRIAIYKKDGSCSVREEDPVDNAHEFNPYYTEDQDWFCLGRLENGEFTALMSFTDFENIVFHKPAVLEFLTPVWRKAGVPQRIDF